MPTTPIVQGLADQAVVAVISPIIRRRSEGPVDMVVSGVTDGQAIALEWARSRYLSGLSYWKRIVPGPLNRRRSAYQTVREGCARSRDTMFEAVLGKSRRTEFQRGNWKRNLKKPSRWDVWINQDNSDYRASFLLDPVPHYH